MIRIGLLPQFAWRGGLAVLALTLFVPASGRAQEEPPDAKRKVLELRLEGLKQELIDAAANEKKASVEVQQLLAEINTKKAELKMLEARLKAAQDGAKRAETPRPGAGLPGGDRLMWETVGDRAKRVIILNRDQPEHALTAPKTGTVYELIQGEKGTLILRPVTAPSMRAQDPVIIQRAQDRVIVKPALPPGAAVPPSPPVLGHRDADPRAGDLEKRLDALSRELEELRRAIRTGQAPEYKRVPKPDTKSPPRPEEPEEAARGRLNQERAELERALGELRKAVEREKKTGDEQPKR
jgi:hypothetical protein